MLLGKAQAERPAKLKTRRLPFRRAGIVVALIFIGGSIPGHRLERLIHWQSWLEKIASDRAMHFLAFAAFAVAMGFDYLSSGRMSPPLTRILLLSGVLGLALEAWQALLPYRSFQIEDLGFDLLGGLAGLAIFWVFLSLRR